MIRLPSVGPVAGTWPALNTKEGTMASVRIQKNGRCEECGRHLKVGERCFKHPSATRIGWTHSLFVAVHLVRKAAESGDAEKYIESAPDMDLTGTTRGDLAYALAMLRKWHPDFDAEMREFGRRTETAMAAPGYRGLFG